MARASFMEFIKMQAAGNDYIYVDFRRDNREPDWRSFAKMASDRHFGIGGDGVVGIFPSGEADVKMRMWNADGSEGQICGNALRCVGLLLYMESEEEMVQEYLIDTADGVRTVRVLPREGEPVVQVNMGAAVFGKRYTVRIQDRVIAYSVDMGNPHLVLFRRQLNRRELHRYGSRLSVHPAFPDGCNVEMVSVTSPRELQVLVWERGSGETLSCGSGAAAVFAISRVHGLVEDRVTVQMPGGTMQVFEQSGEIWLEGPARQVFRGRLLDPVPEKAPEEKETCENSQAVEIENSCLG